MVDDADAKGEFYNWFADSRRLLGPWRVLGAIVEAPMLSVRTAWPMPFITGRSAAAVFAGPPACEANATPATNSNDSH